MVIRNVDEKRWQTMREIIEKLKNEPLTFSDIKTAFPGINDRSLHRYLAELKALGLVNYSDGRYIWFENRITFKNRTEYQLALEHSKKLFPDLKEIEKWAKMKGKPPDPPDLVIATFFNDFFEAILTYDLYESFEQDKLHKKLDFSFIDGYKHHLENFHSMVKPILDHIKTGYEDLWLKIERYNKLLKERAKLCGLSHPLEWVKGEMELRLPREKETELDKLNAEIKKLERDAHAYLSEIMLKVEHGIPLNGRCDFCPTKYVTIKDET